MCPRVSDQRTQRLASVSMPAPGLNFGTFLRLGAGNARFFWQEPNAGLALAGFGIAAEVKAWGGQRFRQVERRAKTLFRSAWLDEDVPEGVGPCLLGGFAFRDDFVPDNTWSVFHPAHFILPHLQLTRLGDDNWLSINVLLPAEANLRSEREHLREALALRYRWMLQVSQNPDASPAHSTNPVVDLSYPMSLAAWTEMIESALEGMRTGDFQKVVLARMCEIRCQSLIDIETALETLGENYPGCYRFLFEPQPRHAFFGATPELLAAVQGENLSSMALAGSIRRGKSPEEDAWLEKEILQDKKERLEHALVVDELRQRLADHCKVLDIANQPEVLKLGNIQHLYTPVKGKMSHPRGILPEIERLHPTPALGGMPRNAAMRFIRQAEPVTRGWYAAPVGWINARMDGVFGVAIRSAVTQNERAWLYAGAGIVSDSEASKEWDETALKFRPALQALGIEAEILVA